jgi:hypothetical protein
LRDLAAEYAEFAEDAKTAPRPRLLTAEELEEFEPPNGYQIALDKLKEGR